MDFEAFIRANTVVEAPQLVPEIKLHLATEVTPLWHATESYLQQKGIEPPFWAFAWVGGQALSRYVLDHPHVVAGLRVLDVGSGGGIVAIAAAMAGAAHVTALDIDPMAAAACRLNAQANAIAGRIVTETADATIYDLAPFDVVLVGDLCYARGTADRLARHLAKAEAPVLFGDPGGHYLPRDDVRLIASYPVAPCLELETESTTTGSVWRMVRRDASE